jgi:transposase
MAKKPEFTVTKEILTHLRGCSPRERFLHRLHSAVLVLKGFSAVEIARIFNDSPRAVAYWAKRFKQSGADGLKEIARPGRPSRLNSTQFKKVQRFVENTKGKTQKENAEMLSAYIRKEFKISLTPRQCWRILNRLNS